MLLTCVFHIVPCMKLLELELHKKILNLDDVFKPLIVKSLRVTVIKNES